MEKAKRDEAEQVDRDDLAHAVRALPKLDRKVPRIDRLRKIVAERQAARMEGVLVDGFTASAIVKVYDAVSDENKRKLDAMTLAQASSVCFKAIERTRRPK